jgi:hypothetical protein
LTDANLRLGKNKANATTALYRIVVCGELSQWRRRLFHLAFLSKPFSLSSLARKIRSVLDSDQAHLAQVAGLTESEPQEKKNGHPGK